MSTKRIKAQLIAASIGFLAEKPMALQIQRRQLWNGKL
jgi:hypothetical protein